MMQVKKRISPKILALFLGLFLSMDAFAQITVKGLVKDATGEGVIGANVIEKGTTNGTITDFDGNFSLQVKKGAILVVSFVGYVTQEVEAQPNLVITLKDDTQLLEDVVVIGYGVAKKNDLTGSVTAIKPDELSKGITTSAQDMLVGKIAGVSVISSGGTPGGGATIRVRGGSSLTASNDPLIVIDGLAMDNNGVQGLSNPLAMVNPEDIESFTVLKDASATAIYGSRASNGVIIITTKKGRKGAKTQVSYNGNVSVGFKRNSYDVLSGDEYRDYVINTLGQSGAGLGTANTDWQSEIYRAAVSTDHQVSISGAVKNLPYRLSLGYTDENGIVKTSNFQRFTASLNLSPSFLNDHLTANISAKYMYSHNRYADGGVFGAAINADPTQPIHADIYATGGWWQNTTVGADASQAGWTTPVTNTNTPQNPVALLENKNDRANSDVLIGGIEVDYKVHGFEDLHIHGKLSGDYSEGHQLTTISPFSYSNNYYGWEGVSQSYKYNLMGNIYAQYAHDFGAHNLDVMVGAEQQHFHRNVYSFGGGNYLGDVLVTDPSEYYSPSLREETAHLYRNSLVSYFGRFNYNLLDRYLLTFTMRADGSSRFAEGNKWGYFPAVGLAWKINEEAFLKDSNVLSDLKLRLGWGITGQQDIGYDFYYTPRYVVSDQYAQYPLGNTNYYTVRPEVFNADLKWEKTATWNAGLDFAFLNGRIDGTVDYYYRKTTDLLSSVSIASGINFGNYQVMNIGSLRNTGVEVAINARPIQTKDFTWQINYNVTWNDNKITELTTGSDVITTGNDISAGLSNKVQVNKVGCPANSFYVYQQVYDADGNPIEGEFVDRNGDGTINPDDKYVYKKPTADVTMGMTNKFIYKNWDFSFTLRASFNNYLYYDFLSNKANVTYSGLFSNSAYSNTTPEAIALGFTGKTDYYMSDYFVRNASFLRCDNINLGYSFSKLFKGANYDGLNGRVYLTVSNPFVITKYDGLDPEITTGVDNGVYPRPTTFMLGLSLNF